MDRGRDEASTNREDRGAEPVIDAMPFERSVNCILLRLYVLTKRNSCHWKCSLRLRYILTFRTCNGPAYDPRMVKASRVSDSHLRSLHHDPWSYHLVRHVANKIESFCSVE